MRRLKDLIIRTISNMRQRAEGCQPRMRGVTLGFLD
jgi:hypothetical protein